MAKYKCDMCGKKQEILNNDMKIKGKPKHLMGNDELTALKTHLGDNKTFEKRYCKDCLERL